MSNKRSPILPPPYSLIKYANNNFVGDLKDQKLVIRNCFFLNRVVVLWSSKKQQTVLILTTKIKYIVLGYVVKKAV